jgi:hypothetical protein
MVEAPARGRNGNANAVGSFLDRERTAFTTGTVTVRHQGKQSHRGIGQGNRARTAGMLSSSL